jgi:hypothetical protein
MSEEQRSEGERRYVFSSNLKLKLSNFMTAGQVSTSITVDAQRRPIWGDIPIRLEQVAQPLRETAGHG